MGSLNEALFNCKKAIRHRIFREWSRVTTNNEIFFCISHWERKCKRFSLNIIKRIQRRH
jgi:hypothetical protein